MSTAFMMNMLVPTSKPSNYQIHTHHCIPLAPNTNFPMPCSYPMPKTTLASTHLCWEHPLLRHLVKGQAVIKQTLTEPLTDATPHSQRKHMLPPLLPHPQHHHTPPLLTTHHLTPPPLCFAPAHLCQHHPVLCHLAEG